jgi:putative phage-type endonuclease
VVSQVCVFHAVSYFGESVVIIHKCKQGSDEWERLRKGKATASEFHRIITPSQLKLSSGAKDYAIQKAAEILGLDSPRQEPGYWMERGTELEPLAFAEFCEKVLPAEHVGFIQLHEGASVGCSPDGLVGDDSLLEIKCPKAETLIEWILNGELPSQYRLQVQGEMWVTGRSSCHFWGWHPEIEPFHLEINRDPKVIGALDNVMGEFQKMVRSIVALIKKRPVSHMTYQTEEVSL